MRGNNIDEQKQEILTKSLVGDFDAQNNAVDRRIYYEVTGRQIITGEFDADDEMDTSDAEWANLNATNPLDYILNYRGASDDDNDDAQEGDDDQKSATSE